MVEAKEYVFNPLQAEKEISAGNFYLKKGNLRAAARRYLITLEHLGYVASDRKMYALTAKVLRLGQSYMHSSRLPRLVQPELYRLAHALKEALQ